MKWQIKATGLAMAVLTCGSAWADGRSAAHNLFANLARTRSTLSINEATAMVGPTLVRGIYALSNQQGRFVGFTNEAGTLFGDSRGFNVVSANGAQPRPIALDEVADLRTEVVGAIDYEKLPKITMGDGGNRRLVMFSSVDCPYCKNFEDAMRKHGGAVNSTIYVVPSALQKIGQGGAQQWQAVSRIWCAEDAGDAWRGFWATRTIPAARQCRFADPRVAETADQQLKDILQAVGVRVVASPQIVREDGVVITNKPDMSASYIAATFGPDAAPPASQRPARWLSAGAEDSFRAQAVGAAQMPSAAPQKHRFSLDDAKKLKELLK